jgi:hypothetical protein
MATFWLLYVLDTGTAGRFFVRPGDDRVHTCWVCVSLFLVLR